MKADKLENSATVADMSKLAIAHNIAQHQKIHALSASITDLQYKLDEVHTSSMVQIQAKELELVHCRNALRAKDQQASKLTRAYEVAKMEAKSAATAGAMEMSRVLSVDGGSSILPNVRARRPNTAGTSRSGQRRQQKQHQDRQRVLGGSGGVHGEQQRRLNAESSVVVGWLIGSADDQEDQDGSEGGEYKNDESDSNGGPKKKNNKNNPTILTRAEYMAMKQ
jgi:hypothetical protein